jgi:hypothetical protein
MSTRSAVLATATVGAATPTSIFTVPAQQVWLAKSIFIYNHGGAPDTVSVWATDLGGIQAYPIVSQSVPAGGRFEWNGWLPMNAGHNMAVESNTGNSYFWVNGAKLLGAA